MIGSRQRSHKHRSQPLSVTGVGLSTYAHLSTPTRRYETGEVVVAESNPAMQYNLPRLPENHSEYRKEQKPCDGLSDLYVTVDGEREDLLELTDWEIREQRNDRKYVRNTCLSHCDFVKECSRDALGAAQGIALQCGGSGRLHGIWGGVDFNGTEGKAAYTRKLDILYKQATKTTGENEQWEPSRSSQTTQSTLSA